MSNSTSVEIVTFNVNKSQNALKDVLCNISKTTDLIVICLQECATDDTAKATSKDDYAKVIETHLNQNTETPGRSYTCAFRKSVSFPFAYFIPQTNFFAGFTELFIFKSDTMKTSLDCEGECVSFDLIRPWKGAIFVRCNSEVFEHPFVFVGAHFLAHEGAIHIQQRQQNFKKIWDILETKYAKCDWSLFGDLNFRRDEFGVDEFPKKYPQYDVREGVSSQTYCVLSEAHDMYNEKDNTFKVEPTNHDLFQPLRTPSRTDRILHNKNRAITISEYNIVKDRQTHKSAGLGSDHNAVYEIFNIPHRIDRPLVQLPETNCLPMTDSAYHHDGGVPVVAQLPGATGSLPAHFAATLNLGSSGACLFVPKPASHRRTSRAGCGFVF